MLFESRENEVVYYIHTTPTHISFTCPHCENEVRIPYDNFDGYEYELWSGYFGKEFCPECDGEIFLGECDHD